LYASASAEQFKRCNEFQAPNDDQEARVIGEVETASYSQQSWDDLHNKYNALQAALEALKKDAEVERQSTELNSKESFDQMKRDFHTTIFQTTEFILSGVDKQITPLEVALSQLKKNVEEQTSMSAEQAGAMHAASQEAVSPSGVGLPGSGAVTVAAASEPALGDVQGNRDSAASLADTRAPGVRDGGGSRAPSAVQSSGSDVRLAAGSEAAQAVGEASVASTTSADPPGLPVSMMASRSSSRVGLPGSSSLNGLEEDMLAMTRTTAADVETLLTHRKWALVVYEFKRPSADRTFIDDMDFRTCSCRLKKNEEEQIKSAEEKHCKTIEKVLLRMGGLEKQLQSTIDEFGELAERSGRLDGALSVVMNDVSMMMAHLAGLDAKSSDR